MELLPCWNMEAEVTYLHVSPAMVDYSICLRNYLSCTPFEMKGVLSVWTKQMLQLQGVAVQLPSPRKSTKTKYMVLSMYKALGSTISTAN